ncbi:hypothetical protein DRO55_05650 [Candidatus Bathyarchaeota archaeon]|nr:MAG: hypothetical protein DRO55_05650 [Candidatus Bathyarchaeota archaeon]
MINVVEEEASYRAHNVVIRGTVEGYNVASLEDLKKLSDELKKIRDDLNLLKEQFGDLQRSLNATNSRLERLENFLRSFK